MSLCLQKDFLYSYLFLLSFPLIIFVFIFNFNSQCLFFSTFFHSFDMSSSQFYSLPFFFHIGTWSHMEEMPLFSNLLIDSYFLDWSSLLSILRNSLLFLLFLAPFFNPLYVFFSLFLYFIDMYTSSSLSHTATLTLLIPPLTNSFLHIPTNPISQSLSLLDLPYLSNGRTVDDSHSRPPAIVVHLIPLSNLLNKNGKNKRSIYLLSSYYIWCQLIYMIITNWPQVSTLDDR